MKPQKRFKAIDLFAGAGLFSHAFKEAGFDVCLAVEKDKYAAETYKMNLGDEIIIDDILKVSPHGKCDVLFGGPPCQGFSTLGKRDINDPRNKLSFVMLEWAKILSPKIVVIENVSSFLETSIWRELTEELKKLGYATKAFELNAYDYGVPQNRYRSITIASKIGLPCKFTPVIKGYKSVKEAWCGLPSVPNGENWHYAPIPTALALGRMKAVPAGGNKRHILHNATTLALPSWQKNRNALTDIWGRMVWSSPCNTLRTCLQNPSKGRYIHPEQNRVISLREAARLHTIPDKWKFAGSPTQVAKQIGNSVPPGLGMAIAKEIHLLLART